MNSQSDLTAYDQPSRALNVLSFVCPPLGLIIYLALVGKLPRQAVSAGQSAIKGACLFVGAFLLMCAITGILEFGGFSNETTDISDTTVGTMPPQPQN